MGTGRRTVALALAVDQQPPIVAHGRVIVATDTGEVASFGLPQGG